MVDASNTTGENTQNYNGTGDYLSYLGSAFDEFWRQCEDDFVHPADKPFFEADKLLVGEKIGRFTRKAANFQTKQFRPCPFDGPIGTAKLVLCLANPNYEGFDEADVKRAIEQQRKGAAELPKVWDKFYKEKIADPLGMTMDQVRNFTAVLNLCPYASSPFMQGDELRLAAGLPSVWQAQKFLREVLIPKAQKDELYLVITRKHQAWGIHEGFISKNIIVSRRNPMAGKIPIENAVEIRDWLVKKGHRTQMSRSDS